MLQDQLAGGVVDLLVLRVIADGETYGYELAQTLTSSGLKSVSEATIYTSVKRLHGRRLLRSRRTLADNGRARRYYAITPAGKRELDKSIDARHQLSGVVDVVLAEGGR